MSQFRLERSAVDATATVIKVGVGTATGPRGITANTLFTVRHDADNTMARPAEADVVLWVGSVEPDNAILGTDMWVNTA